MDRFSIRTKPSVSALYGLALALIFGFALFLRTYFPYDNVFTGDWVRFGGNDPWYHIRLVENLLHHFPQTISFDPYTFYPYGQNVFFSPLFDLLMGFPTWVVGLGSPSQQTVETVGAYFPAILGALVTITVYLIGKELFNRKVGLLSAALIAILPGEFLARSLLGFTDHHVAEVLFSTITILLLILALKEAEKNEISFDHLRNRGWANIKKPLIYALLTGIALGMYLLSWAGGPLFVFILFSSAVFLYIIDHLRGKSTDYLCIIGMPIFLTALILIVPFLDQLAFRDLLLMSLVVGTLSFLVLTGISKLMESRNIRRAYYPLALGGIGLVSLGVFHVIDPSLLNSMLGKFNIFKPTISSLTISEAQPLFSAHDGSPLAPAWNRFTTSVVITPIALILVSLATIKKISSEKMLFLIWTAIMLAAMVGQVRFTYYFAVNAALLSGYFCWRIPGWISGILARLGFRESPPQLEREKIEDSSKRKKAKSRKGRELRARERKRQPNINTRYLKPRYVSGTLTIIVIFFLAYYPNIGPAIDKASATRGSNDDWHSALLWMRDNTPDPFQDPDFYYEAYERPPTGEEYDYPQSAYGVMNWWDYGHWITAIAHRIPNSNPHQAGAVAAAKFFTAQRESTANEILNELGSRYAIIDFYMATPYEIIDGEIATSKFSAITTWAGKSESDFFDVYYWRSGEVLEPIPLLYPEYYQSMSSRLYNFNGKQVVPGNSTLVISYIERNGYKVLSTAQPFPTYEEAKAYLERQTSPNYRIVGSDPFVSPVPLEELEHYQLIHQSEPWRAELGGKIIAPHVKIFEYVP